MEEITMSLRAIENPEGAKEGNGTLMSIREMSALTGVPPHTLRFWEKKMPDVLSPERTPGGQRRYSPEMVERVKAIRRLTEEKRYSLAAIRNHLSAASEFAGQAHTGGSHTGREQAIDLIVNEIARLLKEKLLHLLKTSETTNSDGCDAVAANSTPAPSEGGDDGGLQRQSE
jgi:DNA-binding transcriptional MerR regulator